MKVQPITNRGIVFWSPRVLTIVFALFLGVLATDVFGEKNDILWTLAAFFIHLIPAFIVAAVLALAWRREWIGVAAFAALGITDVIMMWRRFPLAAYAATAGPLFLNSVLFYLSWRERVRQERQAPR
jgi:hypothetical protein